MKQRLTKLKHQAHKIARLENPAHLAYLGFVTIESHHVYGVFAGVMLIAVIAHFISGE